MSVIVSLSSFSYFEQISQFRTTKRETLLLEVLFPEEGQIAVPELCRPSSGETRPSNR